MDQTSVFKNETVEELRRALGSEGLRDLMTLYLQEAEKDLQQLAVAIAENNGRGATFHGHRLKGASGSVGAETVQYYAAAAEALARVGEFSLLPVVLTGMRTALERARLRALTL